MPLLTRVREPADRPAGVVPDSARRSDIQGLRAIAVAAVVAYHAGVLLPGGYVGVDMFFVISGFVITRMLLGELGSTGTIDLRRFYIRRVRRLLPALALVLTIVLLFSLVLIPVSAQGSTARTGFAAALFNSNNYLWIFGVKGGYFQAGAKANPLLHMWSLSVEEQFYFVFPGLLLAGWALRKRRGLAVVLWGTIVVSFVLSLCTRYGAINPDGLGSQIAFYAAPARAWEFAIGGVIALLGAHWSRLTSVAATVALLAGGVMVLVSFVRFDESTTFPGLAVLLPVAGTALLIIGGTPDHGRGIGSVLGLAPLTAIGDVSYGWYLWHWPLIVMAAALVPNSGVAKPAAALVSLPLAFWMYRRFENPIRHRSMSDRRTLRLAAICIVIPLVAGFVLDVGNDVVFPKGAPSRFVGHLDELDGCMNSTLLDRAPRPGCLQTVPNDRGLAVLIGDSNAGQFSEGFMAAAKAAHLDARVATRGSCPFTDLVVLDTSDDSECNPYVEDAIDALVKLKPTIVFIGINSDGYIEAPRFRIAEPDGAMTDGSDTDKSSAWLTADERMIHRLEGAGIDVVLINPVPKFPGWDTVDMAPIRLLMPLRLLDQTYPRSFALAARMKAKQDEDAAAKATGAHELDFFDQLCPTAVCHSNEDGHPAYRDGGHISVVSAKEFEPEFQAQMATT